MNEQRDKVKDITEEEFAKQRDSVLTNWSVKDMSLDQVFDRQWNQIRSHKYFFDKQQAAIAMIPTITKAEFQAHFEKIFFSEYTKKLDFQLTSKAHTEDQDKCRDEN